MKKILVLLEVSVRDHVDPGQMFYANQDFIRGGPLVVTAKGVEYGITAAKVISCNGGLLEEGTPRVCDECGDWHPV